jgi:hypothetical protein
MKHLKTYEKFIFEDADIETDVEKEASMIRKKDLQVKLNYFNSKKGQLLSLLKSGKDDTEKKAVPIINGNGLLSTYWQIIKNEASGEKQITKAEELKAQIQAEQAKMSDPDSRAGAAEKIKNLKQDINDANKQKQNLDKIYKDLQKDLSDKIKILKGDINQA